MNVPREAIVRAAATCNVVPGRAEMQDKVVGLLRDVVRGSRRQHVELAAGEQVLMTRLAARQIVCKDDDSPC